MAADAGIIHSPQSENGVVKTLDGKQDDLTASESDSVAELRNVNEKVESDVGASGSGTDDFAASLLKRRKVEKVVVNSYQDCRYLQPTSNLVERFFSVAGAAFGDLRQKLLPINLEMQLYLKINKRVWNKDTVMEVMVDAGAESCGSSVSNN